MQKEEDKVLLVGYRTKIVLKDPKKFEEKIKKIRSEKTAKRLCKKNEKKLLGNSR